MFESLPQKEVFMEYDNAAMPRQDRQQNFQMQFQQMIYIMKYDAN